MNRGVVLSVVSCLGQEEEDDMNEDDDDDVLIETDTEGEEQLRSSFPKVKKSSYVKPDVSNMDASEQR